MIGRLTGTLLEKQPPEILLEAAGVGYEVHVSMQTFCTLPPVGSQTVLHTQLIVREDAHLLFGFARKEERAAFRQLLKVGGIGAKTALAVLSAMNTEELAAALAAEDAKRLSSIPGIGKKTAERMILELRGKIDGGGIPLPAAPDDGGTPSAADNLADIAAALTALGYGSREAAAAVKTLPADTDVGQGVRLALKYLTKG